VCLISTWWSIDTLKNTHLQSIIIVIKQLVMQHMSVKNKLTYRSCGSKGIVLQISQKKALRPMSWQLHCAQSDTLLERRTAQ